MSRPPRDIAEWMRFMEQQLMNARRNGQANVARQIAAEIIKVRNDVNSTIDTRQPAAPIELTFDSSLYVDNNSRTHAEITIDFPPVTVATDASAIDIDRYELWGRNITSWNGQGAGPVWSHIVNSAGSEFVSRPWQVNNTYQFKVRARGTTTRLPGVFSAIMQLVTGVDTTPPKILPAPVMTQSLGVIMLAWDGLASDDTAMDPDFSHAEISIAAGENPATVYHQFLYGASTIPISALPYDIPHHFRLRSVDHSGNASVWSGTSSITRAALVSNDISGLNATIEAQTERAENAEAAALEAQGAADTAAQNASASAASASSAAGTAATAQQAATAAQSAADASAAEAAAAEAAAAQAAADAAAAEARILEVAGLGGRVWMETDAPSPGTTYNWTGTPQDSTSEMKDETGAVVRTNLVLRTEAVVAANKGWLGSGSAYTLVASERVSERGAGILDFTKTGTGAAAVRMPTAVKVTGQPVSFSMRVKPSASITVTPRIRTYPAGSSTMSYENAGTAVTLPANEWSTLSRTFTIPDGTAGDVMSLLFYYSGTPLFTAEFTDPTIELGSVVGEHFSGATLDDRANDLWIDTDDGNKQYRWDGTAWVEAADESVAAAAEAAQAAQAAAATSASAATAAQTNAQNAQSAANTSATAANQAQAEAEAAEQAAAASQAAAVAAQAASEQAAQDAGSSSAAALAAEEAAEAANTAADAARDEVDAFVRAGNTIVVNGNFDAPITSPPLGWPSRTLTYNEVSAGTARTGTQILRAAPTTSTVAYAYTDFYPAQTDRIFYVEYFIRLNQALLTGNSTQQLGAYYSWKLVDGTVTSTSVYQNNGAAAVTLSQLSTTAWTKVATTYKATTANIKEMRFGPRIPALGTAGQTFEIDDFRVVDITEAQAALDAAAAAQSTANAANAAAGAAQGTANSALTAATTNAKLLFSVDPPSGTAPYGTVWFQTNASGQVIGQWQQTAEGTAGTWTKRDIRNEMIANLDVGKLVGGFIDASHIETRTLLVGAGPETLGDTIDAAGEAKSTVDLWAAAADNTFIDGGKIYTGSVKALQIDVNDLFADTGYIGALNTRIGTFLTNDDGSGNKSTVTGQGLRVTYTDPATGDVEDRVTIGTFSSDFVSVSDASGEVAATMSDEGQVTGREVSAENALYYKGQELETFMAPYSKGIDVSAYGMTGIITNITTAWLRVISCKFIAKPGRNYKVVFHGLHAYSSVGNDRVALKMCYGNNFMPASDYPPTDMQIIAMPPTGNMVQTTPPLQAMGTFNTTSVETECNVIIYIRRETGTGVISYNCYNANSNFQKPLRLWVEDMGPDVPETGTVHAESGTAPPAAPAAPTKVTRTAEWGYTSVKSFIGSNGHYNYNTSKGYQGLSPAGYGNLKSLWTFPSLTSTLSGSTVHDIWAYFYFEHWWYNSGGTARIMWHGNSGQPTTYSSLGLAVTSTAWPKGAGRWVRIPSSLYAGFISGANKGFGLEGDGTYTTYGIANNARIRIKYTK